MNLASCCKQAVCTECFLQVRPPEGATPCPFCNHGTFNARARPGNPRVAAAPPGKSPPPQRRGSAPALSAPTSSRLTSSPKPIHKGRSYSAGGSAGKPRCGAQASPSLPVASSSERRELEASMRTQFNGSDGRGGGGGRSLGSSGRLFLPPARDRRTASWDPTGDGSRRGDGRGGRDGRGERRAAEGGRRSGDRQWGEAGSLQSLLSVADARRPRQAPPELRQMEDLMLMEAIRASLLDTEPAPLAPPGADPGAEPGAEERGAEAGDARSPSSPVGLPARDGPAASPAASPAAPGATLAGSPGMLRTPQPRGAPLGGEAKEGLAESDEAELLLAIALSLEQPPEPSAGEAGAATPAAASAGSPELLFCLEDFPSHEQPPTPTPLPPPSPATRPPSTPPAGLAPDDAGLLAAGMLPPPPWAPGTGGDAPREHLAADGSADGAAGGAAGEGASAELRAAGLLVAGGVGELEAARGAELYATQVLELDAMGFGGHADRTLALLDRYQGRLLRVVNTLSDQLLSSPAGDAAPEAAPETRPAPEAAASAAAEDVAASPLPPPPPPTSVDANAVASPVGTGAAAQLMAAPFGDDFSGYTAPPAAAVLSSDGVGTNDDGMPNDDRDEYGE